MRNLSTILKRFLVCVVLLSTLVATTAHAESRSVFEYLLLYQQSMDSFKYEYEGMDDYTVNDVPMYIQDSDTGDIWFDGGIFYLDTDMCIQRASFGFVNMNADDKKNEENTLRFIAAMCALEYDKLDWNTQHFYYEAGLTENETVLDEALSTFDESFDISDSVIYDAMAGNEALLYEGESYSYYLTYLHVDASESINKKEYEAFYIDAVAKESK